MRKDLKPEDLGDFLEQPKLAILATTFKDGRVLLSPVWHEWRDGDYTPTTFLPDSPLSSRSQTTLALLSALNHRITH